MKNLLMMALILAGAGLFVVFWDSPPEVFLREPRTKAEELPKADSYMIDTDTRKFGEDGREAYRITSAEGRYFTRADRFELDNPELRIFAKDAEKMPWQLRAKKAYTSEQGTRVVMNGDVYAWQHTARGLSELRTSQLIFFPEKRQAESGKKVVIDTPQGHTTGVGMKADFDNEEYRLLSQVKSVHYGQ